MAETNREATATIRGYIYQFDATIGEILKLSGDDFVVVEGIEDFDVFGEAGDQYFQCKYLSSKKLTYPVIRDAILPMFEEFLTRVLGDRETPTYHLYGHFKEGSIGDKRLSGEELKQVLKKQTRVPLKSGGYKMETEDLKEKYGATDQDIECFSKCLIIHSCKEYVTHKNDIVGELSRTFNEDLMIAKEFLYPSAFTLISDLASNPNQEERRIKKAEFLAKINPSKAVYNIWFIQERGEDAYCKQIRRSFFSQMNIGPEERLFFIETNDITQDADLLGLVKEIRRKWSTHNVVRKPPKERYAPYLYFPNIDRSRLVRLKGNLHREGIIFIDGYDFQDAEFCVDSLCKPQTNENQISLRFVNTADELDSLIESFSISFTVYQFILTEPIDIDRTCRQISIPVRTIDMIQKII